VKNNRTAHRERRKKNFFIFELNFQKCQKGQKNIILHNDNKHHKFNRVCSLATLSLHSFVDMILISNQDFMGFFRIVLASPYGWIFRKLKISMENNIIIY
jgi:hypothetical protein